MDTGLPTYENAISKDPWALIAPYISSSSLPACARVSQQWHDLFSPLLWGNPAAHFGVENDAVYVALVRFKRTLTWARLSTRQLTHTLHLPPAHPELYDGPKADWLRTMLERLPKLQSLVVAGLPFFDHAAMEAVSLGSSTEQPRQYSLKLLDAGACFNATSRGLAGLLKRLPGIVYVDLSGTSAARSEIVYQALATLPNLETLKLRSVGLQDTDGVVLLRGLGRRVHSLDVRDNALTDACIPHLIKQCCIDPTAVIATIRHNIAAMTGEWPQLDMGTALELGSPELITERRDEHLRHVLTTSFTASTETEHWRNTGLSHLWVAGNKITYQGLMLLLGLETLMLLDVSRLQTASPDLANPEKTMQTLRSGASALRFLRIDQRMFTQRPGEDITLDGVSMSGGRGNVSRQQSPPPVYELDAGDAAVHEMPSSMVFELPGEENTPIELDGSPLPSQAYKKGVLPPRRSSPSISSPSQPSTQQQSTELATSSQSTQYLTAPRPNGLHSRTYSTVTHSHKHHLTTLQSSQQHILHPYMFPHLRTLILTNIPSNMPSTPANQHNLADSLINLLRAAATESRWSRLRAQVDYTLPPGRQRLDAQHRRAEALFALRRIGLEVIPSPSMPQFKTPTMREGQGQGQGVASPSTLSKPNTSAPTTLSAVEDADCEDLWSAARHDFSFFHEDTEECGQPLRGTLETHPIGGAMGVGEEKIAVAAEVGVAREGLARVKIGSGVGDRETESVDVVGEVARFRREARARFLEGRQRRGGRGEDSVDGDEDGDYWDGEVTVVRVK